MRDDIIELKAYGDNSRMLNKEKNNLRVYLSQARKKLRETNDHEKRKKLQKRIDELTARIAAIPTVKVSDVFGKFDRSIFKH